MPPPAGPAKRNPERFDPSTLARSVIAIPLLAKISDEAKTTDPTRKSRSGIRKTRTAAIDVIIDINLDFKLTVGAAKEVGLSRTEAAEPDPRTAAKLLIEKYIELAKQECGVNDPSQEIDQVKSEPIKQYVFARLQSDVIQKLVEIDHRMAEEMAEAEKPKSPSARKAARGGKKVAKSAPAKPDPAPFRTIYHV